LKDNIQGLVRTLIICSFIFTLTLWKFCHFCEDTGTMVECSSPHCNFVSCSKVKGKRSGCTLVDSENGLKWLCPTHNAEKPADKRVKVSLFYKPFQMSNGKFTNNSMIWWKVQISSEGSTDASSNHSLSLRSVQKREFLSQMCRVFWEPCTVKFTAIKW
jgi:hypothetical protein